MKLQLFSAILIGSVISGCASVSIPQSAAEYRQGFANGGGFGSELESYEIDRPYSTVAKTLKQKSKECLDVKLSKSKCIKNNCQEYEAKYTPTLVSNTQKTELHVQWRRTPWENTFVGSSSKPPAQGFYITVVDAEPAGKDKTKMTIYGPSMNSLKTVPDAAKHWADGSNFSCPDLTKPYYY